MAVVATQAIYTGNRSLNPPTWEPFGWEDPVHGPQVKGEVAVICPQGTSGDLSTGLWRTGHNIAGCEADGSCVIDYSAPLGDETMVILEGTADVTETATGRTHRIEAGTILSHPRGVDLHWEIHSPFLKKFWIMWLSPNPATPQGHLYVAHVNDNPSQWTAYKWHEPAHGPQVSGELHTIRGSGSTGTYMCGLWRTGIGMPGCAPDGSISVPYTTPLGDETLVLLEGQADVTNEVTGEVHHLKAGDMATLPSGLPMRWTSRAPFVRKFWVITQAAAPAT